MIYIPFIVFCLILITIYRKRGVDVSFYMLSVYVISTASAIYLWTINYTYTEYGEITSYSVTLFPTLLFCLIILLCIRPYYGIELNKERLFVKPQSTHILDIICWASIISLIFIVVVYSYDVFRILTSGAIKEIRADAVSFATQTPIERLNGPLRIIGSIAGKISGASYLLIPYFFYSICFNKNRKYFNICVFCSTLSTVFMSITRVDRSATTYYLLQMSLAYLLFKPYFSSKQKNVIKKYAFMFVGLLLLYIGVVSVGKWSDSSDGIFTKIALYIGEPFINFSNSWNNYNASATDGYYGNIFPITSTVLGEKKNYLEYMEYTDLVYFLTGVRMNVFTTFIGTYLYAFGHWGAILLSLLAVSINSTACALVKKESINLFNIYCLYIAGVGIVCGLTVHYYCIMERNLFAYLFLFITFMLCKNRAKNKSNNNKWGGAS